MCGSAFAVTVLLTSRNELRRVVQRTPPIRPSLKHTGRRELICASSSEPPKTKSSFYKNPSKAIEKGGGFYFPGLRGPRLRIFVTVVGFGLLSVNHVASIRSSMTIPPSFTVSEVGALLALFSVLSSVYLDIRATEEENETDDPVIDPQPLSQLTNSETSEGSVSTIGSSSSSNNMKEVFEWIARVAVRMTEVHGVYVFRGDSLIFSSVPSSDSSESGEVVARVAREDKSLFVDDTSRLPEGVDVPFLDPAINKWSLFLVPILSGELVVIFSSAFKANEKGKMMSAGDREWLKQCSNRIQVER